MTCRIFEQLDRETGLLKVKGDNPREIFIPARGLRAIRRILTLPEARDENFTRLDPGFVRRTFYTVAKSAGLKSARGGPRAIRYARGLELLRLHTPLNVVQEFLGLRAPAQIAAFLQFGGVAGKAIAEKQKLYGARGNAFSAIATGVETGLKSAFLRMRALSGFSLSSLVPIDEYMKTEPTVGQTLWAFIIPQLIFPRREAGLCNFANCLEGEVCSIHQDTVESWLDLKLAGGETLEIRAGNQELPDPPPEIGQRLFAGFSARAVLICAD